MAVGYGIFSGGLDSLLSALILQEQGLEVRLLTLVTPFFGPEKALAWGRAIGREPCLIDLTDRFLKMLPAPKHGFGRFANPCIDCHALMFRAAGEIMIPEGGDFLFSGEVLGQRPKSQNRRALQIVARESGFAEVILRPLSAKCLPPTAVEEAGLVDRSRLLGLSGRTRKPQMELAARFGLKDYPTPAGGCLLTDPVFSRRLHDLLAHDQPLAVRDVELLKLGRHFRLPDGRKLIVGRNMNENEALEKMVRPGDLVLKVAQLPGPTVVIPKGGPADLDLAAAINVSYSDAPNGRPVQVRLIDGGEERLVHAAGVPKDELAELMI